MYSATTHMGTHHTIHWLQQTPPPLPLSTLPRDKSLFMAYSALLPLILTISHVLRPIYSLTLQFTTKRLRTFFFLIYFY